MSWRAYIAVLVCLGLVSLAFLVMTSSEPPPDVDPSSTSDHEETPTKPHLPAPNIKNQEPKTKPQQPRTNQAPTTKNQEPRTNNQEPGTKNQEPRTKNQEPTTEWSDTTNARVLGQKTWMAEVSDEENARIDEVFEKARAARHDPSLSSRDRRSSIEVVRSVVDRCFEDLQKRQPGVQGRLILAWESGASDGRGWIRDPRITTNYKLGEPQFESCILGGLAGLTFAAADGEPITVEYPFFYDGH